MATNQIIAAAIIAGDDDTISRIAEATHQQLDRPVKARLNDFRNVTSSLQSLWADREQGGYRGDRDVENWNYMQATHNPHWGYVFD